LEALMPAEPISRVKRFALLGFAGAAAFALSALSSWRDNHAVLVNASTSLPNWAFLLDRTRAPQRGDTIMFDPPASTLLTAHFGSALKPFGKIVYGLPGDSVTRVGRTFIINGRVVAHAKTVSKRGEPLDLGPIGVLPRGCYFVGTPNPDSFDSRYAAIGWICRDRIMGVGKAIL